MYVIYGDKKSIAGVYSMLVDENQGDVDKYSSTGFWAHWW